MKYALLIVTACAVHAQPALDRPVVGHMLDRDGGLRPVIGVGGSFQLDSLVAGGVLATACSRALCLAKTDSSVVSGTTSTPAPAGGALLAIDGLAGNAATALLYFSTTGELQRWLNGTLTPVTVAVDGKVLALRAAQTAIEFAVRRDSGVWIVTSDGTVLDSLPSDTGAVLLLPDSVAYSIAGELVLRAANGAELHFPVAGVTALFALGEGYVEAMTPDAVYALRAVAGREALFVLPQTSVRPRFPQRTAPERP